MKSVRAGAGFAVLAAAAVAVAGCGGAPIAGGGGSSGKLTAAQETYDEFLGLSGQERRDAVVEAAEEEGTLSLYTSMNEAIAQKVEKQFESQFDIDLQYYRASSSTILTKISQEFTANAKGADAVETNSLEMFTMNDMGALSDYSGERRDMVGEQGQFDGWTATRYNVFAPSWNTDLVSADEVPRKWEDLADPRWDGRMAMELEDYDWYMALTMLWQDQGKSDDEIAQLWDDIVDGATVQKGHAPMADLHQAGKFDIAADNYTYIVELKKRAGAPLDYLPLVEHPLARANGVSMLSNAPHPAAALLFNDWFLEEGQQLLYDEGLTGSIVPDGVEDPFADAGLVLVDNDELIENNDAWNEAYQELLQGADGGA